MRCSRIIINWNANQIAQLLQWHCKDVQRCLKPGLMTYFDILFFIASLISTIILCPSFKLPISPTNSMHESISLHHNGPSFCLIATTTKNGLETIWRTSRKQIFIALLILQRKSNCLSLPHWCLIVSSAMYGWGTRDTLGHATSFMGTAVSWSYRDLFYSSLTSQITVICLLSREICKLMVLDNFQCGNWLREQCRGRSSKVLIGTTEAAHHVSPFLNFTWDHQKLNWLSNSIISIGYVIALDDRFNVGNTRHRYIH